MPKRIVYCSLVLCMILTLVSCGRAEVAKKGTLDTMYSVSKAFLNVHYSASKDQAQKYDLIAGSQTGKGANELLEDLIKQKYQTQPLTDKGLESIERNALYAALWKEAIKAGSDINVTSVDLSLQNTKIDDKENDINYSVKLLIDKTSYEVSGTLALVLVDGKWMIDGDLLSGWNPPLQG